MSTSNLSAVKDRIGEMVAAGRMTKSAIARAAGLHANSLRDCDQPQWNPTAETLSKLDLFLRANSDRNVIASPEEIIDEARNGRMFILVDDEDRENEGDLVIPAQMATPSAINFMATHGRGLICLALARGRVQQLGLELMSRNNRTRHETAFTTSIEARQGVTTGISAADRARTISVAIDASKGREDIVTPGHVFPLIARDGGVLTRAGHTEAAVDIARLAGLNPSGVICEIMNDDGSMSRMEDLIRFARMHDLKVGTIRDLIAYRRSHDRHVKIVSESSFETSEGARWRALAFRNEPTGDEMIALVHGRINPDEPVLVRMHTLDIFADVFGEKGSRSGLFTNAMREIESAGAGVIVAISHMRGGAVGRMLDRREGRGVADMDELRDYGVGAQILTELGVHEMILLTTSHHSLIALEGYGLTIVEERFLSAETADPQTA
ncbi:3,4-dihydroxy-2-butanone-4-phosphate synthase [Croceicoccus marinus]|uniref:3,4-dihydroxy-2-butanone 4-phosphate synthase n=1 Tax=Croceicoccus marinus TaxID=450378 RepID=A0A1Z1FAN9_9SPHN|nr:3,4-dihydroxy-2-butanone-4-phosphate synthase [Croceicoccus marinus]ARU15861.1 3,4-dihydroxy-2-butanone-4-phosphate synthase [Croceicoccus marinus]